MIEEDTIVVTEEATPAPPPVDTPTAATWHAMAAGEPFTKEQYNAAGWTDDQLIAAGKMTVIAPPPVFEVVAPIGMPASSWIMIEEHDDIPPTGLFIGHNGVGFLAKTGVPMYMPNYLIAVLDDAIMDAPVTDPDTKKVVGYRPRRRYNYRLVDAPAEAA